MYMYMYMCVYVSKWILIRELIRLTMDLSPIGLRKFLFFKEWVQLNLTHLTYRLNGFEPG